ncbi:polyribonucleotide nucleotidyltransferase [Candidatus Parcubacteria bacterium]|nr:polyribonucleotide nucleotidyltransferase [Candidatus Parcubacteria bacterium]
MSDKQKVFAFEIEWAGRKLAVETGKMANQADSSFRVQYGDTVVLATVVRSKNMRAEIDYFPLMVDYEEKLYAAGKIKGSRFIKREGRPTDEAVLNGRMIDRAIRPLFNDKDRNDIQVILSVLSVDQENVPAVVGLIAASLALSTSQINWAGPIGGVRIGRIDNNFIVNPTYEERENGDLDLVVAGTAEKVIMIEAGAEEISEEDMFKAIEFAKTQIAPVVEFINKIKEQFPVVEKIEILEKEKQEWEPVLEKFLAENLNKYLFDKSLATKSKRKQQVEELKKATENFLQSKNLEEDEIKTALKKIDKKTEAAVSEAILNEKKRVDGRAINEIRKLEAEVGILPRTHGSALFDRGQTQSLSVVTLGGPGDEQILEGIEGDSTKRYMHHYNFPPFSVGETGFMRGPGRRDIGHGALAEKALWPVLPNKEEFPYTIRVVSETLSSNGSSSMASVCGSSLSLMDAGVPLKKAVAGIAIGLASNEDMSKWQVITDIQDLEDGKGGMDFKVAGTKDGITAIQLDTKTGGLNSEIIREALKQGGEALKNILEVMKSAIPETRKEMSPYAPRIISFKINPDKIRSVIGPGGKMINQIIDETGVSIDIEDDGMVFVCSTDQESSKKAIDWIKDIVREAKVGETFQGTVVKIMDFGAFVNILPNQDGMVHISELAHNRVEKVGDVVKIGDVIPVKVIEIDNMGRVNLSLKATQPIPDNLKNSKPAFKKNNFNNGR